MSARLLSLSCLAVACATRSPACPESYAPDSERARRIEALLASDPEGRRLISGASMRLCFAPGGAGVVTPSHLLLDLHASDARLAARVAHLLSHRARGDEQSSGEPSAEDEREPSALEARVFERLSARSRIPR